MGNKARELREKINRKRARERELWREKVLHKGIACIYVRERERERERDRQTDRERASVWIKEHVCDISSFCAKGENDGLCLTIEWERHGKKKEGKLRLNVLFVEG